MSSSSDRVSLSDSGSEPSRDSGSSQDYTSDTGVKGQVGGSIPTGNNPPSMNGRRRVRGWGASGCSNLTASGAR